MDKNNKDVLPRILIIGCGFGGLEAARALRHAKVAITVVDKTNHHLFQPLLYQVATAGLAAPAIAAPIRHILRKQSNVTVIMGEVQDIDVAAKLAILSDGQKLAYDHLIVAAGAKHSYFGHDEWATHAPGLKTLEDAFEIRRTLLLAFEKAEAQALDHTPRQLVFAVIGAGPTGVEMAGTMAEIAHHTLPDEFRRIAPAASRVLLIEGGPRVLPSYLPALSESALTQLKRLKVEVLLHHQVTAIDATGISCKVGEEIKRIDTNAIVWAAGVAASPLGKVLATRAGATLDRAGRVMVEPDLSLALHPEISVIGDLALAKSYPKNHAKGKEPTIVPGVSPGAKQMGRAAASNILRRLANQATQPFTYIDYGSLATIGRRAAIAEVDTPLGKLQLRGLPAWLFWLFIHIYFLIGFRNRLMVFADWAWAYLTFQRNARVVVGSEVSK